nr:hypothetical protein [Pseudoalteromonas sp. WY3]
MLKTGSSNYKIKAKQKSGLPNQSSYRHIIGFVLVNDNKQVAAYKTKAPHFALDIDHCLNLDNYSNQVFDWVINTEYPIRPLNLCHADVDALQSNA